MKKFKNLFINKNSKNIFTKDNIVNDFNKYENHFLNEDKDTNWEYGIFSELIKNYVNPLENLTIVEVGVARGGNVLDTFDKIDEFIEYFIGIDPYVSGYDESDIFSQKKQEEMDYCYSYVLNKIQNPKFKLYRTTSKKISPLFNNESVDAVYIDGDHTYEGVLNDITSWKDKVKKGGIIVGDDYELFDGVREAVKKSFKNFDVKDNSWFVIKD